MIATPAMYVCYALGKKIVGNQIIMLSKPSKLKSKGP